MAEVDLKGFPSRRPGGFYMFGYEGACVDHALARDNADLIEKCYRNDWIGHTTKMLTGCTLLHWAKRIAPKCAERLEALGFPA